MPPTDAPSATFGTHLSSCFGNPSCKRCVTAGESLWIEPGRSCRPCRLRWPWRAAVMAIVRPWSGDGRAPAARRAARLPGIRRALVGCQGQVQMSHAWPSSDVASGVGRRGGWRGGRTCPPASWRPLTQDGDGGQVRVQRTVVASALACVVGSSQWPREVRCP
jgi:hypothetical protein